MARVHLIEIHDQAWCPHVLRDATTDYLQFVTQATALGTAAGATTLLFVFLLILHAASRRWILLPISASYLGLLLWCLRRSRAAAPQRSGGP